MKPSTSVITCDLEGRIQTFGQGAQDLFGYEPDEVIGKARVSLFSPGLVVLGHVGNWLATARETGEYQGKTVFIRRDGSRFPAQVTIRPTFKTIDGEKTQIGYVGITVPLDEDALEDARPRISLWTRIFAALVVVRAPFLTATLAPILVGAAWVAATAQGAFAWVPFIMALIGGLALQLAANTFNDYYDWRSGADPGNNDYFLPFSGGSRSIELRLVKPRTVFRIGVLCSVIATACGVGLVALGRTGVLAYGVFGLFAAWAYTAPPLRLVARRGLGELLVGLCFGPLMVAGVVEALTGRFDPDAVLLGLPIGMLITAVLWINEFPDHDADVAAGKIHLVAVLGKPAARWGYATLVLGAFILLGGMTLMRAWPLEVLAALTALPVGVWAVRHLIRHWADRELVRANAATIGLHFATGLLIAGGLALS